MVGGVALSKSVAAAESVKPEPQIPTVNAQSCAAYGPTTTHFFAKLQVCGARALLGNLSNIMFQ
jgi:hypothetical protein